MVIYKSYVFGADLKFKMASISGHSLYIGRYGKMFQKISPETSKPIESKHCMDGPWMVLYTSFQGGECTS